MKASPSTDRRTCHVPSELLFIAGELHSRTSNSSESAEAALRALDALQGAVEADTSDPSLETPPLPEDLRQQWLERFPKPAARPEPRKPKASDKVSAWLERLGELLNPAPMRAAFALLLLLCIAVFMLDQGRDDKPVLRGGGSTQAASTVPLVLIGSEAQLQEFISQWDGAAPQRVSTQAEADALLQNQEYAIMADATSGTLIVIRAGQRQAVSVEQTLPDQPVANLVLAVQQQLEAMK